MGAVPVRPWRAIGRVPVVVLAVIAAMLDRIIQRMPVIQCEHTTAKSGDDAEHQQP